MRLSIEPTTSEPNPSREFRVESCATRIGLWGPLYFTLWLNGAMLALAALWPRHSALLWLQFAGWSGVLAGMAALACHLRIELHDLMVGLAERDRFLLGLFALTPLVMPAMVKGPRVAPDGFLWATPLVLLLCVTPSLARRFLFLTLIGAWLASMQMTDPDAIGILIGFGMSWLIALGAIHFAWTGDPHGLGGWWPIRKVLFNAIAAAIPASVAALLLWWVWPGSPSFYAIPRNQLPHPVRPEQPLKRLDPMDLEQLALHGAMIILVTILIIVVMHYLRKWLLRRNTQGKAMKLVPGQVAQVEYHDEPPPAKLLKLQGMRGRIVQLWGRWAEALAQGGKGRQPGETAEAFARRLAEEVPSVAPPPEMTGLLERVHYGEEEPNKKDLESMRQFVREQMAEIDRLAGKRKPRA